MFVKISLISIVTLFQIVRKAFIFLVFRSFMTASFIVKNSVAKTLNEVIRTSCSFCASDWDFESLKIVRRFSKTDVDLTKLVDFDVCFFEDLAVNSSDIVNDFLKVWDSFSNFSIFCFSTAMTFFNSFSIFFRVWARVFLNFTSESSNTWITDFSSFSTSSSRLKRFVCIVDSFSNWRRFSRWVFSIDVAKEIDSFIVFLDLIKVTRRVDSFAIFFDLTMNLSRDSDWTTQMSLSISFALIVDTSRRIRRRSSRFLFSSWSWKVWQIIK